ncbi:MAG: NAD(P)H-hydrate epimerase, partial [Clostridia bacterium]|nr:NAD(P)H-hydrate epimerase [Clostridia bacterium]
MRALTNEQMRDADSYTINVLGIPSVVLMQRAGVAIADVVQTVAKPNYKILVVCGTGNNGGDGYVCAQELLNRGFNVCVYAFDGKLSEDCEKVKALYKGNYTHDISGDIIVDCIFGTGLSRQVTGEYYSVIQKINLSGVYVISADIPSGLNGDNGLVLGCAVKANATVAIAEYKIGMFLNDGLDLCGELIKKDIGIVCPDKDYAKVNYSNKSAFAKRKRNTHKGSYGTANIIAGSEKYPGAAVLATRAALKSGCGYVKLTTHEKLKYAMVTKLPQVIYTECVDLSAEAVAIGCGTGVGEELYSRRSALLQNYCG